MTKGHLGRPPAEFGNPPTPTSQDLVNLVPSSTHLATWGSPLALGLCRLDQRLQALHHCRVSLIEVLGHQPWPEFQNFLGKHIYETVRKQLTTNILGDDTGSQQKPATSQLRSFRSEMSSLVSDFTRIQMDQDLQNAFPEIFSWR